MHGIQAIIAQFAHINNRTLCVWNGHTVRLVSIECKTLGLCWAYDCSPALPCPGTPGAAKCPETLCMIEVFSRSSWSRRTTSAGIPPPSVLLRAQAPVLPPPRAAPPAAGLLGERVAQA